MQVWVTSGPATVIAQGEVTTFHGHPLLLSWELPDATRYQIAFRFASDPALPGPRVEPTASALGMTLRCINFDLADGRGSATPVVLGTISGVAYFLHFRVFRYGRTDDRTVHYTIYAAAEDGVHWVDSET
jgi:hypothetical protein